MGSVVSLNEYRARAKSPGRMTVGTRCNHDGLIVTVIGTWAFTGFSGPLGSVETRERRFGCDPRTDDGSKGYLLQPHNGNEFIYAPWGDVAIGALIPIS